MPVRRARPAQLPRPRPWALPDSAATPPALCMERRRLLRAGAGLAAAAAAGRLAACTSDRSTDLDPAAEWPVAAPRESRFSLSDPVTPRAEVAGWTNYLEFGAEKRLAAEASVLDVTAWTVRIDGLVERPLTLDLNELLARLPIEERVYRHRCIEGWAFVAPWTGVPLAALVELARPLGSAKYLRMESFYDPLTAHGQFRFWHDWPYTEALTLAEATHELAFLATGAYGQPLAKQNGAPLRAGIPWKYGSKSIKAIRRFTFVEDRPPTFWPTSRPDLYGFWANVGPEVDHPFGPQEYEYRLGEDDVRRTERYNGYEEWVGELYRGLEAERLFV